MPKRIDTLTDQQREAMAGHAQKWINRGLDTTPVDWTEWEKGARACYQYAGVPFPDRIVVVPSPFVGAVAAPLAAYLISLKKRAGIGAVRGAVGGAVRGAVRGAVGGAVGGAVRDAVLAGAYRSISSGWYNRLWGQWWVSWHAWKAFFRDECHLELDPELWARSYAYEQASTAGWWWPYREFVMVSDRPVQIHLEQVGPAGWGSHRLHCEDGPAISWRDGWSLYYWHGVLVSRELIEGKLTTDDILREPNAEVRRCAIERMGWPQFITEAGLAQVGERVPDPGNPGNELALYDVPEQLFDEPVRVLVAVNGTIERDGTRRMFGLTVPGSIGDPIAAAGWGYGLNPGHYAQAQRRA